MRATKKSLVGRTIVEVDFRPFADGKGGRAFDPVLKLDNGTKLFFTVQETDTGDYGVDIGVTKIEPLPAGKVGSED